jgi:hypothetical protein
MELKGSTSAVPFKSTAVSCTIGGELTPQMGLLSWSLMIMKYDVLVE